MSDAQADGYQQTGAFLSVSTPFGDDTLLLESFSGREALSEPFCFNLKMGSTNADLDASQIVGLSATVTLAAGNGDDVPPRYFNGIVTRFEYAGANQSRAVYHAELSSRLALMALGTDRAIYQMQSAPEIIKSLLTTFAVAFTDKLTGTYAARDYCVCFDETPLAFISRLMEEEGIFYFFSFDSGTHTMILGDDNAAFPADASAPTLQFWPETRNTPSATSISTFDAINRLVLNSVTHNDYDFTKPATALSGTATGALGRSAQYLYPGRFATTDDGSAIAKRRLEAAQCDAATARGTSGAFALSAGGKITVAGLPRAALNSTQVLRAVRHDATGTQYTNAFETFPTATPFRPRPVTPRPSVAGMHTAVVVGPANQEIWTDKYGRVKVQFTWDRLGKKDDTSSCWLRVAQTVAGQGWGALFLPRIGQEVLVSYVDGDPDRPLVTGSVYNGTQSTPVTLPANQTQSVIRSRSSTKGTAGNELRFEDKTGSEQLYMHAQKDMQVDIENDLATTLIAGNETHTVSKGNRTIAVQTGNETHTVKGTRSLTVTGNETHTNSADFSQTVSGNYTLKVTGDLVIDVTGSVTIKSGAALTVQAGTSLTNKAGTSLSNTAGTSLSNSAGTSLANKAGTTLSNEGLSVSNKASASQTVDGGGMLTIKGGLVSIN